MQILGNVFNIVIFITFIGAVFSLAEVILKSIFRVSLPLWFGCLGIFFFLFPVIVPQVQLIPGEKQVWISGYVTACYIWVCGASGAAVYYMGRRLLAARALKNYETCCEDKIRCVLTETCAVLCMKNVPEVLYADLKTPVCVVTVKRPIILISRRAAEELTERELGIVLGHELMHIKRRHNLLQRFYDAAAVINWFNLLFWFLKADFELICEMDCDRCTLSAFSDISAGEYAAAMVRLMELPVENKRGIRGSIGALEFFMAKQRLKAILCKTSRLKRDILISILTIVIVGIVSLSAVTSRTHFYPYPGLNSGSEYSEEYRP